MDVSMRLSGANGVSVKASAKSSSRGMESSPSSLFSMSPLKMAFKSSLLTSRLPDGKI